MANLAYHQMFGRQVVTRAISRVKTPQSRFQLFLGMGPGGPATDTQRGMTIAWDIMDMTRQLAPVRPMNAPPANLALQPVGRVTAAAMRTHGKIEIMENRLYMTRPLGGNEGQIDVRGQQYVTRQETILAQKFKNAREFMVSRMLRGVFYVRIAGDEWYLTDTSSGAHITVDYQVPAGNKSKLDMLGAGDIIGATWANAATDIPGDLFAINAAFEQLHGRPLRHIWCDSIVMSYVLNNTAVKGLAGTANRVFETFTPEGQTMDGIPDTGFRVVLMGIPWITWHVYEAGLDVDVSGTQTFTKFIDSTHAIFLPDMGGDIAQWIEGSELQRAERHQPAFEAIGFSAWTTPDIDPPRIDMKALDIGLGALYIPKCVGYGLVVF